MWRQIGKYDTKWEKCDAESAECEAELEKYAELAKCDAYHWLGWGRIHFLLKKMCSIVFIIILVYTVPAYIDWTVSFGIKAYLEHDLF